MTKSIRKSFHKSLHIIICLAKNNYYTLVTCRMLLRDSHSIHSKFWQSLSTFYSTMIMSSETKQYEREVA